MPQRRNNVVAIAAETATVAGCCSPSGCLMEMTEVDDLSEAVKLICNNDACNQGEYMHKTCFEVWETSVLNFLRSCGRARSWSEKQRLQNLWTKKGYDLAFKACGCRCGRGHIRKDLDWIAPKPVAVDHEAEAKKKKKNKAAVPKATPIPVASLAKFTNTLNSTGSGLRLRANSLSSGSSGSPPEMFSAVGQVTLLRRRNSRLESANPRERHVSESSGLFAHRLDFSNFNVLPRHKLNSYHIKMEDEGSFGNDDIRCFILSNLASARMSRAFCVLCHSAMVIFDRYPIIDGTFFLTPRQYTSSCIPVTSEGKQQYLSAVCMACLEGWNHAIHCRSCWKPWDGSSLILGTMYSYDIFAAVPCCQSRLRCNKCHNLVVSPEHRFPFFSYYSRDLTCPHCGETEPHFVKPLPSVFQLITSPPQTPSP